LGYSKRQFAFQSPYRKPVSENVRPPLADVIAALIVREGLDYPQTKTVFKAARLKAGLKPPPKKRGGLDRLTLAEELRFIDQAYAQGGRMGLMMQVLLETGARVSEFVQ
jgi:integrase/recombinase XerD